MVMEFITRGSLFECFPKGKGRVNVYLCCMDKSCQCTSSEREDAHEVEYNVSVTEKVLIKYDDGYAHVYDLINEKELEVDNDDNDGRAIDSIVLYEDSKLKVRHLLKL